MGKKYAIAAIITMVIGSGYILYTSGIFQSHVSVPTAPDTLDVTEGIATSINTESTVSSEVKNTTSTNTLNTYENKELGFGFSYPIMYGDLQIKKFVSVGSPDVVKFSTFSFPSFSTSKPYLGIKIEGNEYDTGKEGISHPVCSKPTAEYNCIEKLNKTGTKYFEVHLSDGMTGNSVRFEFPLKVEASLVFYYYEDDSTEDVIQTLRTIMDSVKLI